MPKGKIEVRLIKTIDEMDQAMAIRREVFMGEQGEPEEEQFDGNDFCAAHLLATIDGNPVGTMRLRIVSSRDGGTIIWERLSVRKEVRGCNPWLFRHILRAARRYSELMGVQNIIGIVENEKLMRFWNIYGGRLTNEEPLDFRGHKYHPIRLKIEPPETPGLPTLREAIQPVPDVFNQPRSCH